jgi:hypothetical protein
MAHAFPSHSFQFSNRTPLNSPEFEPLLDTFEAAGLLRIHSVCRPGDQAMSVREHALD